MPVITPHYRSLAEAIVGVAAAWPNQGFTFGDLAGHDRHYDFPALAEATVGIAAELQRHGLKKGDRIGLVIVEPEDFVLTFLAAVRLGLVPVPLYPPLSLGGLDAYREKTRKVLRTSGARALVASARLQNLLWAYVDDVPSLQTLLTVEALRQKAKGEPVWPELGPDDLAFLQYTSGSTHDPKGVMVTHGAVLANIEVIMRDGLEVDSAVDKGMSWLPLYHDMGLIGFVLAPLVWGMPVVYVPTVNFLKKPSRWLETIHRHRSTICFAPPFAYPLLARKATPEELGRWDLSCMKVFGVGAEPISAAGLRSFVEVFSEHCQLRPEAVLPAYGLAETSLALCFKPVNERFRSLVVDAAVFQGEGRARPVTEADRAAGVEVLEHVSCGPVFPGHEMYPVDDAGQRLPEGVEGELRARGPSVTPGYFENPEATASTFRDGALYTGDLGYVWQGEVYITGRMKDLIIQNGRNIHPQSVEWAVADLPGVRQGNVVAFSRPGADTEEIVLALETRPEAPADLAALVAAAVQQQLGLKVADVVLLQAGTLPKTSSGKLQRRQARTLYLTGDLGQTGTRTPGAAADKMTVARHMAKGLLSRAKNTTLAQAGRILGRGDDASRNAR